MSQLLSGKNKGRFGAPPEAGSTTSPWRVVPLYFAVPLTVIFLAVSGPAWLGYYSCGERHESICASGGSLRSAETGTISGVVLATGVALGLAVLLMVVASLRVRKWPLVVIYTMAALGLVLAVCAFLALNGSLPTPFGTLGDIARLP